MDFDNTISVGNVSIEVREEFAPKIWKEMEAEYDSGKYSVEESNVRQYSLISANQNQIEAFVLENCHLKDGFSEFVKTCTDLGAHPVIVSSGLDFYIKPLVIRADLKDLEVISAIGTFEESGIHVNYLAPDGSKILSGFKETFLRGFKIAGHPVIYFGDNESDFVAATESDFVFACDGLIDFCKSNNIAHREFCDFFEASDLLVDELAHLETKFKCKS